MKLTVDAEPAIQYTYGSKQLIASGHPERVKLEPFQSWKPALQQKLRIPQAGILAGAAAHTKVETHWSLSQLLMHGQIRNLTQNLVGGHGSDMPANP